MVSRTSGEGVFRPARNSQRAGHVARQVSDERRPRSFSGFNEGVIEDFRTHHGQITKGPFTGRSLLLLTTRGAKSGRERTHPLAYTRDGDRIFVIASKGGAPTHPDWYRNLKADPNVWIQIKGDKIEVTARDATPDERPAMWKHMTEVWPDYDNYQKKTDREIPVVVLERA